MKDTETRKIEKKLIEIYNLSLYAKDVETKASARNIVQEVERAFKIIDTFYDSDYLRIVRKLYLCRDNVLKKNLECIASEVFLSRKALLVFRKRSSKVINFILSHTL